MSYDHLGGAPQSMEWNYNGSQIACLTKEKQMHILDPRQPGDALKTAAHGGSKTQRLQWLGKSGNIISQGFSEFAERQYAVWDPRQFDKPLTMKKLDNANLVAWLHYDDSSKVLYVVNKAQVMTDLWYFNESGPDGKPHLQQIDKHVAKENIQGMYFMPKSDVNFMDNELERCVRYTGKTAEYISFKVKRMSGAF